jgi:Tfp pilus assembly protein PilN
MKFTLNMASRRYINRRLLNRFYLGVILFLSLLLLMLIANGLRLAGYAGQFRHHLAQLKGQEQVAAAEQEKPPSAAELAQLRSKLEFARKIMKQDQFRWTDLLDRLEDVSIEGIRVRTIEPNYQDGSLILTALARDDQVFRDFLDNLLTSGQFSDVYLLEQNQVQIKDAANNRQRTVISFRVELKGAF